ncbi:MAG: protein kinase, partial [Pseudomonadota bacterium]
MTDSRTRIALDLADQYLAADPAERELLLQRTEDPNIRAQVLAIVGAITQAGVALGDGPVDPDTDLVGTHLGDYHLQARLGEGGMGAVYLAERSHQDFQQTVAVKVMRGRFMASELIRRFHAERDILASLRHPYIAQLIDGGSADGVPYLVMEYIEGQPVSDYLDARQASIRERVEMLIMVATAVQAAHQNLVVHRDLKPSNVLVTADGIPKLLDFGIAKIIDHDGEPGPDATQLGRQALTPDYASPEQILEGRVTTLSDVYSLGVLAYEILAGERPYRLDPSSAAAMAQSLSDLDLPRASKRLTRVADTALRQRIASARGSSPQRLSQSLQGDLDNILMKALAREPTERYESVAAFSRDLQHFLDGQPVSARAATLGYRLQRFVGRNRLAVAFSAALLLSLMVGLVASTALYWQAESARAEATARFDQVRSLARTMMFNVYDDIARIPGTASLREELAGTAQTYLETLATSDQAPAVVRLDAAEGYARLYTILNREAVEEAGNRDQARAAYDSAIKLFIALTSASPEDASAWRGYGKLLSTRASDVLTIDNDVASARTLLTRAEAALANAHRLAPRDADITESQQLVTLGRANAEKWADNYQGTIEIAGTLIDALEPASELRPSAQTILGDALQMRGEAYYWIDQYPKAIADYGDAIAAYQLALVSGGEDQAVASQLSNAFWSRGNSYVDTGKPELAALDYAEAVALVALSVARDPDDQAGARQLAILRASQAMALVQSGERERPLTLMGETNDWFEAQALADPDTAGPQRSLAISYYMMADIYRLAERSDDSCAWFRRSLAQWRSIDERFGMADFDKPQIDAINDYLNDC